MKRPQEWPPLSFPRNESKDLKGIVIFAFKTSPSASSLAPDHHVEFGDEVAGLNLAR